MRKNGYGVLASNNCAEKKLDFSEEIESRLTLPHPRGDGSNLTLVTRLMEDGRYEFLVEDVNRQAHIRCLGNLYDDTGVARPQQEGSNESEH